MADGTTDQEARAGGASFTGHGLDDPDRAVLLSVPHAGRHYPPELLARARVPAARLQRLEDRYADLLARAAIAAGFPCIIAHRPRAWIDLNRSVREVDVGMVEGMAPGAADPPNARVRGGLGLVPRWLGSDGELWRDRLTWAELDQRIAADHRPYHRGIARSLSTIASRFGGAMLLDLHSMPPLQFSSGRFPAGVPPRIVIGDRFGRSASSRFASLAAEQGRMDGWKVALNHPYPGGHILEEHGAPARNIHAVQLEIDRSLYLDASLREPVAGGVDRMAGWILQLAQLFEQELAGRSWPQAAE